METFLTIFLSLAVTVVTALLFGGWVVLTVARWIARGIGRLFALPPMPQTTPVSMTCDRRNCRAVNPSQANFCRRCGRPLRAASRRLFSRAALW